MFLNKKSKMLLKTILLSTIFISPEKICSGMDLPVNKKQEIAAIPVTDHETVELAILKSYKIYNKGYILLQGMNISPDKKKNWLKKAFNILKVTTDIDRPFKYSHKIKTPQEQRYSVFLSVLRDIGLKYSYLEENIFEAIQNNIGLCFSRQIEMTKGSEQNLSIYFLDETLQEVTKDLQDILYDLGEELTFNPLDSYKSQIDIAAFKRDFCTIEGWDEATKSFNFDVFRFQYLKTDRSISDIEQNEIDNIMEIMLVKIIKKVQYLEEYQKLSSIDCDMYKNTEHQRNDVISGLFDLKTEHIIFKKRFTDLMNLIIQNNAENSENHSSRLIKFHYKENNVTKTYSNIKSKMEKSWKQYEIGMAIITNPKTSPSMVEFLLENISTKTLPSILEGLDTSLLCDYYSHLSNRNKFLDIVIQSVERKYRGIHLQYREVNESSKAYDLAQVLEEGKDVLKRCKEHSLPYKIEWFRRACSLLKHLQDKIFNSHYNSFLGNTPIFYSNWNEKTGGFDSRDDFKIGLLYSDDKLEYIPLKILCANESYFDDILHVIHSQLFKKAYEVHVWGKIEFPIDQTQPKQSSSKENLAEYFFELNNENKELKNTSTTLIDMFLYLLGKDSYNTASGKSGSTHPIKIVLESTPSQLLSSYIELPRKIHENETDAIKDLPFAINILNYQNIMITKFNKSLEEIIKTTKNKIIDNENQKAQQEELTPQTTILGGKKLSEMTKKERLQHKLSLNKIAKLKEAQKDSPSETKEIKSDSAVAIKQFENSVFIPKKPSNVNAYKPKKKKGQKSNRHVDKNTTLSSPAPIPVDKNLEMKDSIQLVNINGKRAVKAPGHPFVFSSISPNTPQIAPAVTSKNEDTRPAMQKSVGKKTTNKDTQSATLTNNPVRSQKQNSPNKQQPVVKDTWVNIVEGTTSTKTNIIFPVIKPKAAPDTLPTMIPPIPVLQTVVTPQINIYLETEPAASEHTQEDHKRNEKPADQILEIKPHTVPEVEVPIQEPLLLSKKPKKSTPSKILPQILPVIKNGTIFYDEKETPPSEDKTLTHNYWFPGKYYDQTGLYTPALQTIIPTKGVKEIQFNVGAIGNAALSCALHVYHHGRPSKTTVSKERRRTA